MYGMETSAFTVFRFSCPAPPCCPQHPMLCVEKGGVHWCCLGYSPEPRSPVWHWQRLLNHLLKMGPRP